MNKADVFAGIIGILASIFVFFESAKFPKDVVMSVGPSYFPNILATGLLVVSGILIIKTIIGKNIKTYEKFDVKDSGVQRSGISLLCTIVYCLVLNYMGFIISSIIYLMSLMYLLKKRNYIKMTIISIGVTLSIYFVFKTILNITLPVGFLG